MKAQRSIAIIAFLITGWIIASLALSGDVFQATVPINSGLFAVVLFESAGDIILTVIVLLLLVVFYVIVRDRKLLIEKLKALFSHRKGMRTAKKSRDVTRDIIGFLTLFGLIIALRYSGLLQSSQQNKGGVGTPGPVAFPFLGFDGLSFQSSLIAIYHFFAVWAVEIILFAIVGFTILIFGQAVSQMRASKLAGLGHDAAIVQDTMAILQSSARKLMGGTDPRGAILECYRRLCEIFDSRIDGVHHQLTARELQEIMISQLNVPTQPLSRLTTLFEEARYSPHSISIEMKENAINALREIEESLRYPSEVTLQAIQ